MRKKELALALLIYLIIIFMNFAGLPKLVCDMGNHVFVGLCLVFCLLEWKQTRNHLLLLFMIFTFLADVTSGFSATFAIGVAFFFVSQILMSLMIWKNNGGRHGWVMRGLLILAGLAGIGLAGMLNPFYAFGVVYFMWFVANVIQAVTAHGWDNILIRTAMVLYLVGDICLISNLLVPKGGLLTTILTYGTWVPYLPAVLMIALSHEKG